MCLNQPQKIHVDWYKTCVSTATKKHTHESTQPICMSSAKASSPYGQRQWGQLKQASQRSQGQGSRGRWAHSGRAHQRWKEAGQSEGQEDETAEENIQEGAEGGARKCLHLNLVLHLEENMKVELRTGGGSIFPQIMPAHTAQVPRLN